MPALSRHAALAPGPHRADELVSGDPYEISNGHLVECMPTGGRGSQPNRLGASVLGWDPAVKQAGVDTGYTTHPGVLRAPDVAIGNVPDKPGWVAGVPDLALEYADIGQDEDKLKEKIADLLQMGTKVLWVVRLSGPRRVEVHEPGKAVVVVGPGGVLTAPGVLKNAVRVEALYERDAAERATLVNLLQRQGYDDLEAVLAKGRSEGRDAGLAEGLRAAVRDLCEVLGIELSADRQATLDTMGLDELEATRAKLKRERAW